MKLPRWIWLLPLGVLLLIVAANGVRLGMQRAALDEGTVIAFYADQYLQDHARLDAPGEAALTDCVAVPGTDPGIWIVVRCQARGQSDSFDYYIRSDGALAFTGRERDARPEA